MLNVLPSVATVFHSLQVSIAGIMDVSDIPQFVTITFDDGIIPTVSQLVKPLTEIVDRNGCGIKTTFYTSIQGGGTTDCSLVRGLYKGQHEIATHTYNHIAMPGADEIIGAKNYLVNECGIPPEEIRGFRSPNLSYIQETLDSLNSLGFLYDSTIGPVDYLESNYGRENIWPFTLDQANIDEFMCSCDGLTSPNPGLWEIPMWPSWNSEDVRLTPTDYPMVHIQENFERTYNGNRAPLGIFLHASWLASNGAGLKNWIENILTTYADVHFVTTSSLSGCATHRPHHSISQHVKDRSVPAYLHRNL